MDMSEKKFLFYFPGAETNIVQTAQGKRLIIKCTNNRELAERLAASNVGLSSDDRAWSFPLTPEVREFLSTLPQGAQKPVPKGLYRHALKDGEIIRQYPDGQSLPEKTLSETNRQKLTDMIRLRETARDICLALLQGDEAEAARLREECLPHWRDFVTKFGALREWHNHGLMRRDPEWGLLRGLGDGLVPGHLLQGSLQPSLPAGRSASALLTAHPLPSLADAAGVFNLPQGQAAALLREWGLAEDIHGRFRPRAEIVSQTPHDLALAHRGSDTLSHGHAPSVFDDLSIRPGLPWLGADIHERWLRHRFPQSAGDIRIAYFPETGAWHCTLPESVRLFAGDWGYAIPHLGFGRLLEDIMNCRATLVSTDGEPDEECMRLAEAARARIIEDFRTDMRALGLAEEIVRRHDALFPIGEPPVWEDLCPALPGCRFAPQDLYPHQRRAIRRLLTSEAVFLDHEVGAGKTRIECIAAMEWRRLGLARRTLMAVPSAIIEQMYNDLLDMYPFARVVRLDAGDVHPRNTAAISTLIRGFDPDVVLVSHETFARLRAPDAWLHREARRAEEREDSLRRRLQRDQGRGSVVPPPSLRSLDVQTRMDVACLDCNALIIDEAHLYKHATTRRGQALEEISGWLRHAHGRIILASGTPLANDPMELYRMQRYLQRDELERCEIFSAAAWRKTFLEPVRTPEPSPDGMGYRYRMRWRIMADGDIRRFFGQVEDRVRLDDCADILRPEVQTFTHMCKSSLPQREMSREIAREIVMGAHILPLIGQGRLLSLCPPLLGLPLPPKGKMVSAATAVADLYHADPAAGQLVFMDLGVPHGADLRAYGVFMHLLADRGVAREDMAYVQGARTRNERETLFRRFREGYIRVLIGSTQTMGEGANLQTRLAAVHHLDCPWRPKDFTQRVGRAQRQGNRYRMVDNHVWFTEDSLDGFVAAVNNRKYHDFIRGFYGGDTPDDGMLSRMLHCRGDMSRQITLCHAIELWPAQLNPLIMENEEMRHWKTLLLHAADMVYLLAQDYWRTDRGHIYPARCWPSLLAMEVEQVSLHGLGKRDIRQAGIDGVPLFVLACGMEQREKTLDKLMRCHQLLDAGKPVDLSFFQRQEDVLRTMDRLEGRMSFNLREDARRRESMKRHLSLQ